MGFLDQIDLCRDVVWRDQNVMPQITDDVNAKRRLIAAVDRDHVGGVAVKDLAAGVAAHTGKRVRCVVPMLASKGGGNAQRERMLARAARAL